MSEQPPPRRSRWPRRLSWAALIAAVVLLVLGLATFVFSVSVTGRSMNPALHGGDRLLIDVVGRHHIRRFDVVEVNLGGTPAVKRVIGLPGDRVTVTVSGQNTTVLVQPAGSNQVLWVDNPAWRTQQGNSVRTCCAPDGRESPTSAQATVPDGSYWVIGDNWGGSEDSRVYGFVTAGHIGARLNFRILPLKSFGLVPHDVRLVSLGESPR